jgi:Spy/CpxP family protein refolding chaperone
MKRHLILGAIVLLAAGATAFAFGGPRGPQGFHKGPGGHGGPPLGHIVERMSTELGLSDAQKATIEKIVAEEREAGKAIMEKLHTSGDDLRSLGTDGQFDEARVRAIAEEQAKTMVEMTVARERTKAKIFAALTPEQRTTLVEKMKSFGPPPPRPGS